MLTLKFSAEWNTIFVPDRILTFSVSSVDASFGEIPLLRPLFFFPDGSVAVVVAVLDPDPGFPWSLPDSEKSLKELELMVAFLKTETKEHDQIDQLYSEM